MDANSAASVYRQASIENAPPIKIVQMLYEGVIRFLERANRCDPTDPKSMFLEWLSRADDIICELRLALDHGESGDISDNLEQLYLFCETRLGDAVAQRSKEPIPEVIKVLGILSDAWQELELQSREVA